MQRPTEKPLKEEEKFPSDHPIMNGVKLACMHGLHTGLAYSKGEIGLVMGASLSKWKRHHCFPFQQSLILD